MFRTLTTSSWSLTTGKDGEPSVTTSAWFAALLEESPGWWLSSEGKTFSLRNRCLPLPQQVTGKGGPYGSTSRTREGSLPWRRGRWLNRRFPQTGATWLGTSFSALDFLWVVRPSRGSSSPEDFGRALPQLRPPSQDGSGKSLRSLPMISVTGGRRGTRPRRHLTKGVEQRDKTCCPTHGPWAEGSFGSPRVALRPHPTPPPNQHCRWVKTLHLAAVLDVFGGGEVCMATRYGKFKLTVPSSLAASRLLKQEACRRRKTPCACWLGESKIRFARLL